MADLLISTLTQGLIYALISFGVYITYSILDFPDLGVDGTFPLGAAVTAVLLTRGVSPLATLAAAIAAGALAGLFTGVVHVCLKVRNLLAGIITMTALFSINLQIAGSNLTVDRSVETIFTAAWAESALGGLNLMERKLVISLVLVIVVKVVLDLYFKTKSGLLLRAVGDNADLVTTLAKDRGAVKIFGPVSYTHLGVALDIDNFSGTVGGNVSGTSDLAPLDQQAAMVKELFPNAKTVGLVYCSGEPNSQYQVDTVKGYLEDLDYTCELYSFVDSNDVTSVVKTACDNSCLLYTSRCV